MCFSKGVNAMRTVRIDLVSPAGVPLTLEVDRTSEHQTIFDLLDRAEKIGAYFSQRGWSLTHIDPDGYTSAQLPRASAS